ncbi:MAG TPA: hypothetical protein VIX19_11085 [Terriglobales bacterium]
MTIAPLLVGPHLHLRGQPNGKTDIDLTVIRDGKNLKGRMLGFVLKTVRGSVLKEAFENSVKAIEARTRSSRTYLPSLARPCG